MCHWPNSKAPAYRSHTSSEGSESSGNLRPNSSRSACSEKGSSAPTPSTCVRVLRSAKNRLFTSVSSWPPYRLSAKASGKNTSITLAPGPCRYCARLCAAKASSGSAKSGAASPTASVSAGPAAGCGRRSQCRSTTRCTASTFSGLSSTSSAPCCRHTSASVWSSSPLSMQIGRCCRCAVPFTLLSTSMPSSPGITMSSSIRSYRCGVAPTFSRASSPLKAVSTS
mmetsp:Transcript_2949/g.5094  ORF Transcript_2949/g.5094 Transcript_2949/m.5094 type:complete len:225 (+) Transcript_2949:1070-1744(+)